MNMGREDVKVSVELSFMEVVQGCAKMFIILTGLTCETCGGAGVPPGTRPETCKRCRGSGMRRFLRPFALKNGVYRRMLSLIIRMRRGYSMKQLLLQFPLTSPLVNWRRLNLIDKRYRYSGRTT
ncbi:hypothetical protein ACS0TY_029498 [Phlomoides rotata]